MKRWFEKTEEWFMNLPQEKRALAAGALSVFNVFSVFRIDLRTLISLWTLGFILTALIVTGYVVARRLQNYDHENFRHFIAWVVFPALLHVLLMINYYVSFNPQPERYVCKQGMQYEPRKHGNGGGYHANTLLYLDHNAYEDYPGIRVFVDQSQIKGTHIRFTFERGIFGLRVMKDWEFY